MFSKKINLSVIVLGIILLLTSCQHLDKTIGVKEVGGRSNSLVAQKAPYVMVVSFDGFRYDFVRKYKPPFLSKFSREGVQLDSLKPSFPTSTFPNHYSLVTGLYPEDHGLVDNRFFDSKMKLSYSYKDPKTSKLPEFYGGTPLWVLAEKNQMRSATYYWPGSETKIQGFLPSDWKAFKFDEPHENKIHQVEEWLRRDPAHRPHIIFVYFHQVDTAGHGKGLETPEIKEAVFELDGVFKQLVTRSRKIIPEMNIILVSDHGLTEMSRKRAVYISELGPRKVRKWQQRILKHFQWEGDGALVHFYYTGPSEEKEKWCNAFVQFVGKHQKYVNAYRRGDLPARYHYSKNPRIGDVVLLGDLGWYVGEKSQWFSQASHGFDNEYQEMQGIFYASGPAFKSAFTYKTLENVNLYPLVAHILDLPYPESSIDGRWEKVRPLLK